MSDYVIRVENIGKKYVIAHQQQERYPALRDVITERFKSLGNIFKNSNSQKKEEFWALKEVSFEIKQGERVGFIGRNGAGKSTLLKILSRITVPSTGRIAIKGRVASLLEVGTGFHTDLTGRENIYLNGAILGMSNLEIKRKFDEIVAFADVEKFLDTPVKRYSSGMYVRLAFAVAAHLEPEILIVDEVLAVGDIQFQKKCIGKMEEVGKEGRTVLFVSHNLGILQSLCNRGILLSQGKILKDDTTAVAAASYLKSLEKVSSQKILERKDRSGNGRSRLIDIEFYTDDDSFSTTLVTGSSAVFVFYVTKIFTGLSCFFTVYNQQGQPVTLFDSCAPSSQDKMNLDQDKFICRISEMLLIPGIYRIDVGLWGDREMVDFIESAVSFEVEGGKVRNRIIVEHFSSHGNIVIPHQWIGPNS
jgi:lipopolysaccharide transport system ATP-binding protein